MRNYYNYFTEIEEYFVRKRGKNLTVSPLDWCLIELWKENKIPLHVVMRGIDRSFESTQKTHKKAPRTLFYCHPAVMEVFEEHRQAALGGQDDVSAPAQELFSREEIVQHLQELQQALRAQAGDAFPRAVQRLAAIQAELEAYGRTSLETRECEQIDRELSEVASMVTEHLERSMEKETLRQIKEELKQELKIYKKRLSKEMYSRLEKNYLGRKIRETHNLPEFSLFALTGMA